MPITLYDSAQLASEAASDLKIQSVGFSKSLSSACALLSDANDICHYNKKDSFLLLRENH